ncbi:MAG: hypothetical protein LBQ88_01130, partial [Treponema sp.]|nr:hypothetical protein [Treponema sp.]
MKNESIDPHVSTFYKAVSLLVLTLVLAVGCDNFMLETGEEDAFKEKIEEDVWVATAPQLTLTVRQNGNEGATNPTGSTTVKQRVPFRVNFTPDKDYAFVEWRAYTNDEAKTPLDATFIEFANKNSEETDVTVMVADGNILIQPYCIRRVTVQMYAPTGDNNDRVRNMPIEVRFTKPIDPNSLIWQPGEERATVFKNIRIRGSGNLGDGSEEDYEKYFADPVLEGPDGDKRKLSIAPKADIPPDSPPPPLSRIYVSLDKNITDTQGYTMADTVMFNYTVGPGLDDAGPDIRAVEVAKAGHTDLLPPLDVNERRVKENDIVVIFSAFDEVTRESIGLVNIAEKHLYTTDGSPGAGEHPVYTTTFNFGKAAADDSALASASDKQKLAFAYAQLDEHYKDNITVVPYTLQSGDGVIELTVSASDSNDNWTSGTEVRRYILVKDTTPPPATTASIGFIGPNNEGWLNVKQSKLAFKSNGATNFNPGAGNNSASGHTILDSSAAIGEYRTGARSDKIEWSFRLGTGAWTGWYKANAALPGVNENNIGQAEGYAWLDAINYSQQGVVPIFVRLRDDLGNETGAIQLDTVKKDTQPPLFTGGENADISFVAANGGGLPSVTLPDGDTYTALSSSDSPNDSPKARFKAVDQGPSGIAAYAITTGTLDLDRLPSDSDWVPVGRADSIETEGSLPNGITGSEGIKPVHIWLKDEAGNIGVGGAAAVTNTAAGAQSFIIQPNKRVVFVDNGNPTVEQFYMTRDAAPVYNGGSIYEQGTTVPGGYYSNKVESGKSKWFFGFIAADTGVGVDRFTINDGEPGAWSTNFSIYNKDTVQTDGNYTVCIEDIDDTLNGGKVFVKGWFTISGDNGARTVSLKAADRLGNLTDTGVGQQNVGAVFFDNVDPGLSTVELDTSHTSYMDANSVSGKKILFVKGTDTDKLKLKLTVEDAGDTAASGVDSITVSGLTSAPQTVSGNFTAAEFDLDKKDSSLPVSIGSGLVAPTYILYDKADNTTGGNFVVMAGDQAADYVYWDTAPASIGSVTVKSADVLGVRPPAGSISSGNVPFTNDFSAYFTKRPFTVTLNNVTELGSGIQKIYITGNLNLTGSNVKVKVGATTYNAAIIAGDNTATLTLEPRNSSNQPIPPLRVSSATFEITGLSISQTDDDDAIEGQTLTVSARLEDGVYTGETAQAGNSLKVALAAPAHSVNESGEGTVAPDFRLVPTGMDSAAADYIVGVDGVDLIYQGIATGASGLAMVSFSHPDSSALSIDYASAEVYLDNNSSPTSVDWVTSSYSNRKYYYAYFSQLETSHVGVTAAKVRIKGLKLVIDGSDTAQFDIQGAVYNITCDIGAAQDTTGGSAEGTARGLFDNELPEISSITLAGSGVKELIPDIGKAGNTDAMNLNIGFKERGTGLKTIVFADDVFTPTLTSGTTGTATIVEGGSGSYNWDSTSKTLTFTSPYPTSGGSAASTIVIPGTISSGDGTKLVQINAVTDVAGNAANTGPWTDTIYMDRVGPVFSDARIKNAVAGYEVAGYTGGAVTYTVKAVETGAGLGQITFGGNMFTTITGVKFKDTAVASSAWSYTPGVLSFTTRLASVGEGADLEITGTVDTTVGEKSISITAGQDRVDNAATSGSLDLTYYVDTAAPSVGSMAFTQAYAPSNGDAVLQITFTDLNGAAGSGAGLKTLKFEDNNFQPETTSAAPKGTAHIGTETGTGVAYSYSSNTITFDDSAELRGNSQITLFITGTVISTGTITATLNSVSDQTGNTNTNSGLPLGASIILDTVAVKITGVEFVDASTGSSYTNGGETYTKADGAKVKVSFIEEHSGINTLTLSGGFTPTDTGTVQVGGTGDPIDFTAVGKVITFAAGITGNSSYIEIPGTLDVPDGQKTISVTEAKDAVGNISGSGDGVPYTGTNTSLDTTPPGFGPPILVNAGSNSGFVTNYTAGLFSYTVPVTESGSGIKQIVFASSARFAVDEITDVEFGDNTVNTSNWSYSPDSGILTFNTRQASPAGGSSVNLVITGTITGAAGARTITLVRTSSTDNLNQASTGGDLDASITLDTQGPQITAMSLDVASTADGQPGTSHGGPFSKTGNANLSIT